MSTSSMSCPVGLDVARLRAEVQSIYSRVAEDPSGEFHFHRGPDYAAGMLGYDRALLDELPAEMAASFAGVANPFAAGTPAKGATVVDVGSGAGTDACLAARHVGASGRVIGVDPTPAMLDKARRLSAGLGLPVEFRRGSAEELPVDEASVDLVISNGVLNLAPDKAPAFAEILRVLKPGGRLQLADIVVASTLSDKIRGDIDLWTGWIGGALPEAELIESLSEIGFRNVRVVSHYDPFAGTSKERVARKFGVVGITVEATK